MARKDRSNRDKAPETGASEAPAAPDTPPANTDVQDAPAASDAPPVETESTDDPAPGADALPPVETEREVEPVDTPAPVGLTSLDADVPAQDAPVQDAPTDAAPAKKGRYDTAEKKAERNRKEKERRERKAAERAGAVARATGAAARAASKAATDAAAPKATRTAAPAPEVGVDLSVLLGLSFGAIAKAIPEKFGGGDLTASERDLLGKTWAQPLAPYLTGTAGPWALAAIATVQVFGMRAMMYTPPVRTAVARPALAEARTVDVSAPARTEPTVDREGASDTPPVRTTQQEPGVGAPRAEVA
jgi:hypothetical protein